MPLTYENFSRLLHWTPADLLLLKNLCSPPEARAETCHAFLRSFAIDDADRETRALMPFFLHQNSQVDFDSAVTSWAKDIFRQVMGDNSRRTAAVLPLIRAFNQAAVPVLLLKGLALGHVYYQGFALRAMGDVDIAAPADCFDAGLQIARTAGAQQGKTALHSVDFTVGRNVALDFHCTVFKENYGRTGQEKVLWEKARPIDFHGAAALILCPEHLLIGTLINAFTDIIYGMSGKTRLKKWLVDVAVILQQKPAFDLELFVHECYRFRLMPQIICLLRAYQTALGNRFGVWTVDDIVRRLENEQAYNQARLKLFAKLGASRQSPARLAIRDKYWEYLYLSDRPAGSLAGFRTFIYKKHRAENFGQYVWAAGSKAIARLKSKHVK